MNYASQIEPDAPRQYSPSFAPRPDKVMFEPGDTVRVRQFEDAPRMVVKEASKVPHETEAGRTRLIGILCFWYLPGGVYEEKLFNTKDLVILDKARKD
ncbi:hypothetical protein [Hymenobacter siberiensis]|uniref:hypothetical protein n=1 Tax=Hymenobacter siberiensis TaxID=2848396 RepID=UPI001C1E410A|nr:hypothetical protein [Hymenobacter siberiensis]